MSMKTRVPVSVRRAVKIGRARVFETVGSERFGRPALAQLDTLLAKYLPEHGTFLEIGANDGYSQSNTYYLERYKGWTGVLIEPLPSLCRMCRRVRRHSKCFNLACVADPSVHEVTLEDSNLTTIILGQQSAGDELARMTGGKRITVEAATLSHVLDVAGQESVTFMSIDVEGAEMSVLGGLDFDRHCPEFLLVETKYPEKIDALVGGRMRRLDKMTVHDYLWQNVSVNAVP